MGDMKRIIPFATMLLIGCGGVGQEETSETGEALTTTSQELRGSFDSGQLGLTSGTLKPEFLLKEVGGSHLFNVITFIYDNVNTTTPVAIEATHITLNCSGLIFNFNSGPAQRFVIAAGSKFTRNFNCLFPATSWDLTVTYSF